MRYKTLGFGTLSVLGLLAAGCGGGGGASSTTVSSLAATPTGKITTFATVAATKAGTVFYIVLDRPTGKITAPIKLVGTVSESSGRSILLSISNQPVGAGDAGALIIDSRGNSVGALNLSLNTDETAFTATPIEDEEATLLSGPSARVSSPSTGIATPHDGLRRVVQGVSPYLWSIMAKDPKNPITKLYTLDTSPAPKSGGHTEFAKTTAYGSTIFIVSSYGGPVTAYTTGAVTTPYLNKLLCFGHSFEWEGTAVSAPAFYGSVLDIISDQNIGYTKIAYPNFNKPAGALVEDGQNGVVVDPAATATLIPINGTVTYNANPAVSFTANVASDPLNGGGFVLSNISQGISNIVNAIELGGSSTGTATVDFANGTSTTVDLTDTGSSLLISDLYFMLDIAMTDPNTGVLMPIKDLTFNVTITSSAPSRLHSAGRPH